MRYINHISFLSVPGEFSFQFKRKHLSASKRYLQLLVASNKNVSSDFHKL